jgi:hypothetical protein
MSGSYMQGLYGTNPDENFPVENYKLDLQGLGLRFTDIRSSHFKSLTDKLTLNSRVEPFLNSRYLQPPNLREGKMQVKERYS